MKLPYMKLIVATLLMALSGTAFADYVNCFWVVTKNGRGVEANALSGTLGGNLMETTMSAQQPPEVGNIKEYSHSTAKNSLKLEFGIPGGPDDTVFQISATARGETYRGTLTKISGAMADKTTTPVECVVAPNGPG